MSYRPNRLRRPASPKKIKALRIAGFRYSSKRSAWVHRAFNGRVGPVFVDPADEHPRISEAIVIDSEGPRRNSDRPAPALAPMPLPERPVHSLDLHRPELAQLPLPPRPMKLGRKPSDVIRVKVRLSETEEPRVVRVDGRPPRRGVDPRTLATGDHVVVPLKSARATG